MARRLAVGNMEWCGDVNQADPNAFVGQPNISLHPRAKRVGCKRLLDPALRLFTSRE